LCIETEVWIENSGCWAVGRVYIDSGGVEEEVCEEGVESMNHISVARDWLCYARFRYICDFNEKMGRETGGINIQPPESIDSILRDGAGDFISREIAKEKAYT
jgi:hypothetical protein